MYLRYVKQVVNEFVKDFVDPHYLSSNCNKDEKMYVFAQFKIILWRGLLIATLNLEIFKQAADTPVWVHLVGVFAVYIGLSGNQS